MKIALSYFLNYFVEAAVYMYFLELLLRDRDLVNLTLLCGLNHEIKE